MSNKKCCFKGLTNCNDCLISNCHIINLGYGEESTGKVVKHNGFWFARDGFFQGAPYKIICRQTACMKEETWREARRVYTWEGGARKNKLTLNELAPNNLKDLYELNVAMINKEGYFDHRYPKPVTKNNISDDALAELFSEACVVLKKAEENWSSNDYRTFLRWKMKNDNVGKIRLKKDRGKNARRLLVNLMQRIKKSWKHCAYLVC